MGIGKVEIQKSSALFLLLSPAVLSSQYTQNWVAWETGVASAANKEIWVFEDPQHPVHFPIPKVTNYMPYTPVHDHNVSILRQVVELYRGNEEVSLIGVLFGLFLGGLIGRQRGAIIGGVTGGVSALLINQLLKPAVWGTDISCPYDNCKAQYTLRSNIKRFPCPVCRQAIVRVSAQEIYSKLFRPPP